MDGFKMALRTETVHSWVGPHSELSRGGVQIPKLMWLKESTTNGSNTMAALYGYLGGWCQNPAWAPKCTVTQVLDLLENHVTLADDFWTYSCLFEIISKLLTLIPCAFYVNNYILYC